MTDFNKLDDETKFIINMYTTARQFKNAISDNEKIAFSSGKVVNKIYPYIVNKSFACEIYLKLIIVCNGDKYNKIHTLKDLYNKSNIKKEFENYIIENITKYNIDYSLSRLHEDLNTISTAFSDWRYIFEKKDLYISVGFLNLFCEYLDNYCLKIIKNKCEIDMANYTFI